MEYKKIAYVIVYSILLSVIRAQHESAETARSLYVSGMQTKGGWRPILSSSYNLANVIGSPASIGQKIVTGPALVDTKGISPFTSSEIFLSTSTRPIVTREVKNIGQGYKPTIYSPPPQSFNAPVNSYLNPFVMPNHYKSYQYDSGIFIRHPQTIVSHRPPLLYTKMPTQPKRPYKHNQMPHHVPAPSHYHPTYTNSLKKPIENFPTENNHPKQPVQPQQQTKHVNPQQSLDTQTKNKQPSASTIAAVSTYKPPLGSHFQQFGLKEDPFGPIPSSILGSFSSFGHATVKARDPTSTTTSTKSPFSTVDSFVAHSTASYHTKTQPKDVAKPTATSTVNFQQKFNADYAINTVHSQPNAQLPFKYFHNYTITDEKIRPLQSNDFIPSPVDPLSKFQNSILSPPKSTAYSTIDIHVGKHKPDISSFFDTTLSPPISTIDPFEPQSTNAIPNNLLVQVPPPYTGGNVFNKENVKNQNNPNKETKFQQSFTAITHGKHGNYDEVKYYPTRGHEYFEKIPKNPFGQKGKDKVPQRGVYEVTEHWGLSGEANTQPTLHPWISPSQSFKQFNSYVPKNQYNTIADQSKKVIPPPFFPTPTSSGADITSPGDISTIYPSAPENTGSSVDSFFSQLENSLSTLNNFGTESGDEGHDLATPVENITYFNDYRAPSTEFFEETTTTPTIPPVQNSRRKPSKHRTSAETTTIGNTEGDGNDFTTHYETYKEPAHDTENDLLAEELATLPPNKHFKRPSLTTTAPASNHWEDEIKKRNKNRRRKPNKPTPTDANPSDTITTTELPRVNKYRTTLPSRNKYRFNKNRYTKPESDPTTTTTTPRQKWNSRLKSTSPISLDLDDLGEITTQQSVKLPETNNKQSSIMKIAKDSHKPKVTSTYDIFSELPDYTHKQDEKDTPTSDISVSSVEYTFGQVNSDDKSFGNVDVKTATDAIAPPTSPGLFEDSVSANSINQATRSEQLFTEQKSGSRGSTKADSVKSDSDVSASSNLDISSTTPSTPVGDKLPRLKIKSNKYDNNRPRFSVKDYRNRLNQISTSTTTEKPHTAETGPKLKFPSRSRFPILKDHSDKGSDSNSTTEAPRKKFTPKDPRHRGSNDEDIEDNQEEKPKTPLLQNKHKFDGNPIIKPINPLRGGFRRDSNRNKTVVTTEITITEEKSIESSSKRPSVPNIRKRISQRNNTEVSSESKISEVSDISSEITNNTSETKIDVEVRHPSESAIMKIAKDDKRRQDEDVEESVDPSQRVADLTLASSKEYNTPGLFKSVSPNSRRIPSYFTIATDDPILPIEAFFPQLNQKKES